MSSRLYTKSIIKKKFGHTLYQKGFLFLNYYPKTIDTATVCHSPYFTYFHLFACTIFKLVQRNFVVSIKLTKDMLLRCFILCRSNIWQTLNCNQFIIQIRSVKIKLKRITSICSRRSAEKNTTTISNKENIFSVIVNLLMKIAEFYSHPIIFIN